MKYEPKTAPGIMLQELVDQLGDDKALKAPMAFLKGFIDVECLDHSPDFQAKAEEIRLRWNSLVEQQKSQPAPSS